MITYYALFFILVSLSFVEIAGKKIDGLKLIILLLVVLLSGLRYNIGDDFANYTYIPILFSYFDISMNYVKSM